MDSSNQIKHLSFILDGELYAIEVTKVREVLGLSKITKLPRSEDFVLGIINVRGIGIPVVDLRSCLGLNRLDDTTDTSIIVLEARDGELVLGALADEVHEVIDIDYSEVEPMPHFGSCIAKEAVRGIGKKNEDFIVILDIENLFTDKIITATLSTTVEMDSVST